MNKKSVGKKVIAGIAALSLVATLNVGSIFAAPTTGETENDKVAEITKKVTKPTDVFAPATTFTFTIKPGTAIPGNANQKHILAGPDGGVTFENNTNTTTLTSAPTDGDIGQTELTTGKAKLVTVPGSFTAPGIYRYVVTETQGAYKGLTYDTTERYFDVYVNSDNQITYAAFVSATDSKHKDDGVFINDYDKDNNKTGDQGLGQLVVNKTVTGTLGNRLKEFDFDITITGQNGKKFNLIIDGNKQTLESGVAATFKLKHGQKAIITGLSSDDTYSVSERDYTAEGYTTTYSTNTAPSSTLMGAEGVAKDPEVTVTNDKNLNNPTGVMMTFGPFALLVAAAGMLLFVFARRRRSYED